MNGYCQSRRASRLRNSFDLDYKLAEVCGGFHLVHDLARPCPRMALEYGVEVG